MATVVEFPFLFLEVPKIRLPIPRGLLSPSANTVFCFVFFSYFIFFSGIIYDVITETPAIGSEKDSKGNVRPMAILPGRVNGQFIIEGLSAGFLFCLGGIGFMLLDKAQSKGLNERTKLVLLISGIVSITLAYNVCITFLKMKVGGYMH